MRLIHALRPAAAMAALCFLTISASQLRAEERPMDRLITVSATGYATAEPDQARISTGVTSEAETAKEALAANSELMQKVIAGLKESGIDAKDIQTSNFNVEPRYDIRARARRRSSTATASRTRSRSWSAISNLSAVCSISSSTLGANQMNGLTFEVSKAETLKDEARKEAVANARRRAELLAAAAGAGVGEVVSIAEEVSYQVRGRWPCRPAPRPIRARRERHRDARGARHGHVEAEVATRTSAGCQTSGTISTLCTSGSAPGCDGQSAKLRISPVVRRRCSFSRSIVAVTHSRGIERA